jgi:hypothetical protein
VLSRKELEHILPRSVVGVGSMEQVSESSSRLNTTGEHIVASPIVAASSGTGMMYNAFELSNKLENTERRKTGKLEIPFLYG